MKFSFKFNSIQFNSMKLLIVLSFVGFLSACEKSNEEDILPLDKQQKSQEYKQDITVDKENEQNFRDIRNVGEVISSLMENKDYSFLYEILAAIKSEYYLDEMVFIGDLLDNHSELYAYEPFAKENKYNGQFKKYFDKGLSNSKLLEKINNDVTFYLPYSENHLSKDVKSALDKTGVTIVLVQVEAADVAFGLRYYDGKVEKVRVDEDYVMNNLTLIIGMNEARDKAMTYKLAQPTSKKSIKPTNYVERIESILQVSSSRAILTVQLDPLFGTINSGGSEIMIGRINGYLKYEGSQINSVEGNVQPIKFRRGDISNKREKDVFGYWDYDWNEDNLEQVYAVWEEDTKGSKTFSGGLKTTIKKITGIEIEGNINYSVTVETKDPIVRQLKLTRRAFLETNVPKLTSNCTAYPNFNDRRFLFGPVLNYWIPFDCGANSWWVYTLPYEQF